ncbi:MAG: aminoacyl-tRNA hydrolase [Phaeodactylibacter sp.]|nr:aminoacyl-tRNA hydrolase [Phaeodactylibacter sp.]
MEKPNLDGELVFRFSRSQGSGGQHVNKVATRVELRFNILESQLLDDASKEKLLTKLSNRISKEGDLILSSQATRSQHRNKQAVQAKFYELLEQHLTPEAVRRFKPIKANKAKRLKAKRLNSDKKRLRGKVVSTNGYDLSL